MIFDWRVFACYTQQGGYNSARVGFMIEVYQLKRSLAGLREKGEIPGAQTLCGLLELSGKEKAKKLKPSKYSVWVLLIG